MSTQYLDDLVVLAEEVTLTYVQLPVASSIQQEMAEVATLRDKGKTALSLFVMSSSMVNFFLTLGMM